MAVVFATDIKREGALYVDYPENILLSPQLNGRHENTDVTQLAADIEKNGQREPCLIRKNDEGQPVLVYGHRRWRAVKLINSRRKPENKIKLLCNYESLTDEEAFIAAIGENRFRKDVTPIDDSHNIGIWQKRFKKTVEDIAEIYFPEAKTPEAKAEAVRWVKVRAALQELAPEAADGVRKGEIKVTAAVALARMTKDQQRRIMAKAKSTVAGRNRIKVKDVPRPKAKASSNKTGIKAIDPDDVPFDAPVSKAAHTTPILAAAEALASAMDTWLNKATNESERALVKAHREYRKLVPLQKAAA